MSACIATFYSTQPRPRHVRQEAERNSIYSMLQVLLPGVVNIVYSILASICSACFFHFLLQCAFFCLPFTFSLSALPTEVLDSAVCLQREREHFKETPHHLLPVLFFYSSLAFISGKLDYIRETKSFSYICMSVVQL